MNTGRRFSGPLAGWLAGPLCLLAGCAAPRLPPADFAQPGWRVQETQAVWRPRRDAPELVGELLVAVRDDGSRVVQFSKQSLPLVTARSATNGWRLTSPLRSGAYAGSPPPTDRVPWFQLDALPPHATTSPRWDLTRTAEGGWTLSNPRTGEMLEAGAP